MGVGRGQVRHIAALANLKFSEEAIERFTGEMNQILRFMEKLDELDLTRVDPTCSSLEEGDGAFRGDRVRPSIPADEALRNAPKQDRGQFLVPRILS
ncbi:MAG: Asp-tRNA(Asn)/Glu-tRNA(Gln) amidotransferase subunit GatC [Acidobacteria bacterium]|nr:Asp-tRNA(Asn)/Glu-tRNA(Gln) amidotransferase subunit GatC [Acidobacteriota bacterium]